MSLAGLTEKMRGISTRCAIDDSMCSERIRVDSMTTRFADGRVKELRSVCLDCSDVDSKASLGPRGLRGRRSS